MSIFITPIKMTTQLLLSFSTFLLLHIYSPIEYRHSPNSTLNGIEAFGHQEVYQYYILSVCLGLGIVCTFSIHSTLISVGIFYVFYDVMRILIRHLLPGDMWWEYILNISRILYSTLISLLWRIQSAKLAASRSTKGMLPIIVSEAAIHSSTSFDVGFSFLSHDKSVLWIDLIHLLTALVLFYNVLNFDFTETNQNNVNLNEPVRQKTSNWHARANLVGLLRNFNIISRLSLVIVALCGHFFIYVFIAFNFNEFTFEGLAKEDEKFSIAAACLAGIVICLSAIYFQFSDYFVHAVVGRDSRLDTFSWACTYFMTWIMFYYKLNTQKSIQVLTLCSTTLLTMLGFYALEELKKTKQSSQVRNARGGGLDVINDNPVAWREIAPLN